MKTGYLKTHILLKTISILKHHVYMIYIGRYNDFIIDILICKIESFTFFTFPE